jgi:hypothetical protein
MSSRLCGEILFKPIPNNPKPVSFDFVSDPFLQSGRTTGEFAGSSSDLTAPKTKCASRVGIADPPGAKGEL